MKSIPRIPIAAVMFVVATVTCHAVRGEVLVWYSYGETGSAAVLTDVSGNSNHGTATGAVFDPDRPPGADDIPGVSLSAGSLVINGNLNTGGTSNASNLLSNATIQANGGFTMETWLYRTALNNNTSGSVQKVMQLEVENFFFRRGSNQIGFSDGTTSPPLFTTVPVGEWHHVAAVFDSGLNPLVAGTLSGELRLYLDGDLMLSQAQLLTTARDVQSTRIFIGRGNESDSAWNGKLFETRVTLGTLDSDEFLLPALPSAVPEPGSLTMLAACALTVAAFCLRKWKCGTLTPFSNLGAG